MTIKTCIDCTVPKPFADFYFNRKRNCHDSCCKECRKARSVKWMEANKERASEIRSAAVRRYQAANVELRREQCRDWYARNAEQQRERIRLNHERFIERRRAYAAEYDRLYPEKTRARSNKRRALKLRAIPVWADFEAIDALHLQAKAQGLEVDHIVPLNSPLVCGLHCEANMQLITRLENIKKGNRWWPDMP